MPAHAVRSGRVRRRRFAIIFITGLLVAGFLGGGIASGELPANIAISGQPFTATIKVAEAESITLFPRRIDTKAGNKPSIAILLKSATLTDVCMSTVAHVPLIGDVTMFLRVPGRSVTAREIVFDASSLGGSIGVKDIHLGVDVSSVGEIKGVATTGVDAGSSVMTEARVQGLSFTASSLSMRGFRMSVEMGSKAC